MITRNAGEHPVDDLILRFLRGHPKTAFGAFDIACELEQRETLVRARLAVLVEARCIRQTGFGHYEHRANLAAAAPPRQEAAPVQDAGAAATTHGAARPGGSRAAVPTVDADRWRCLRRSDANGSGGDGAR